MDRQHAGRLREQAEHRASAGGPSSGRCPRRRAVTPSITSAVLATSISMIVTSPGRTGTSGGRSSVRTSDHPHAALDAARPPSRGGSVSITSSSPALARMTNRPAGLTVVAPRGEITATPTAAGSATSPATRRTANGCVLAGRRCARAGELEHLDRRAGRACTRRCRRRRRRIMAIPGLSWPSSVGARRRAGRRRRGPSASAAAAGRAAPSATNVLGDLAVGEDRPHQPDEQGPLVAVVRRPGRDEVAQLDARQRHAGARVGRRARSPRRPAAPARVLRRMSHRNRLTVGRVSLALQSRSGGSNETSTSWALSGTVARKNASRVASMRSNTGEHLPQCPVAAPPTADRTPAPARRRTGGSRRGVRRVDACSRRARRRRGQRARTAPRGRPRRSSCRASARARCRTATSRTGSSRRTARTRSRHSTSAKSLSSSTPGNTSSRRTRRWRRSRGCAGRRSR